MRTKNSQGRAKYEKRATPMTKMTVCYSGKTLQSTSDNPYTLYHIKASGFPVSNGYRQKSECKKNENNYQEAEIN